MPMNGMRRNDDEALDTAGTKKKPSVAIVILNWNGKNFLEKFLPSVTASAYENKRVIVVDNASTDDSVYFLEENYKLVEIIQHSNNEGFAKGYNSALKQVESDYYVLLNSDVEVTPDWICPVIELMETDKLIAACQPKILSYYNKEQFEYAGASGGWMDNFGYPFMRGRIFDHVENDTHQYDEPQACFWASGAAFFVRSEIYHASGGLDEYFFAHQEEIDFCWRMQLAGYKIYVEPKSIVYHVGGGTLPMGNNKKVFLNFRNNLIALSKNLPTTTALWKIPFRILLDWIASLQGLLKGEGGYFSAIMKAHFHFINWFLFNKRKSVFPATKKGKPAGCYAGSIVWDYFIKKKKTFSEIVGNK
jgi:GT2 family glycosyltransferase